MTKKNVHMLLVLVAILWGVGITVSKLILDADFGVFEFLFVRFLLGALTLLVFNYKAIFFRFKN